MTWELVVQVLGFVVGGGIFAALVQLIRTERVDRVSELARHQQEALVDARAAELRLREVLSEQKSQVSALEDRWRERFEAMEARYEAKCEEIENRAREREQDYLSEIALLRAEIYRLQTAMIRCGIDPSATSPGAGESRTKDVIKY